MSHPLLRFDGGLAHDPAIDIWLDGKPAGLGPLARSWFARMRACGPDVRELMHDGFPTACVEDAPFAYADIRERLVAERRAVG